MINHFHSGWMILFYFQFSVLFSFYGCFKRLIHTWDGLPLSARLSVCKQQLIIRCKLIAQSCCERRSVSRHLPDDTKKEGHLTQTPEFLKLFHTFCHRSISTKSKNDWYSNQYKYSLTFSCSVDRLIREKLYFSSQR